MRQRQLPNQQGRLPEVAAGLTKTVSRCPAALADEVHDHGFPVIGNFS
jgi:hypothetical protein